MATASEVEVAKRAARAIEHMATRITQLAETSAKFVELSRSRDEALSFLAQLNTTMQALGDLLNSIDAVDDEDERSTDQAFIEMEKLFGAEND